MEISDNNDNDHIITDTPIEETPPKEDSPKKSPSPVISQKEEIDQIEELKTVPETNFFVKIQGLPSDCSIDELLTFLSVDLPHSSFKFLDSEESRKNGEAFIVLDCEEKCRQILSHHNQELRGNCVEIYPTSKNILVLAFERIRPSPGHVVHFKAVKPDMCTKDKIYKYLSFHSADLYEEETASLILCKDIHGRNTGEAYVAVKTREMAERIVQDTTNDRFITKLKSLAQLKGAVNLNRLRLISMERTRAPEPVRERPRKRRRRTPTPPPRKKPVKRKNRSRSRTRKESPVRVYEDKKPSDHFLRVFGLPNNIIDRDVVRFFAPLDVISVKIERRVEPHKLPSALAYFRNHYAAVSAMKNDHGFIGDHCIRLSLFSVGTPPPQQQQNRWSQQPPIPRGFTPSRPVYDNFPQPERVVQPERVYNQFQMPTNYYRPETAVHSSYDAPYTAPRGTAPTAYKRYTTVPEESSTYNAYMKKSYETYPREHYSPPSLDYGKRYGGGQNYSEEYCPAETRSYPSPKQERPRFNYYSKGGYQSDRVYEGNQNSNRYFY